MSGEPDFSTTDPELKSSLNELMETMKLSLVNEAELFADSIGKDQVDESCLEMALYKSIMTLNQTNKAIIIKKLGIVNGMRFFEELEAQSIKDINGVIIEEIMENYDNLPEELKTLFDEIKKNYEDDNSKED